jgi:hypothetical protein
VPYSPDDLKKRCGSLQNFAKKTMVHETLFLGDLGLSHGSDTLADGHKPYVLYYKNNVPIPNLNPTSGWQEYFNTLHGV